MVAVIFFHVTADGGREDHLIETYLTYNNIILWYPRNASGCQPVPLLQIGLSEPWLTQNTAQFFHAFLLGRCGFRSSRYSTVVKIVKIYRILIQNQLYLFCLRPNSALKRQFKLLNVQASSLAWWRWAVKSIFFSFNCMALVISWCCLLVTSRSCRRNLRFSSTAVFKLFAMFDADVFLLTVCNSFWFFII